MTPVSAAPHEFIPYLILFLAPFLFPLALWIRRGEGFSIQLPDIFYVLAVTATFISFLSTWRSIHPVNPIYQVIAALFFYSLIRLFAPFFLDHITSVMAIVLGMMSAEGLLALGQFFTGSFPQGHFRNPNELAMYLALGVPLAMTLAWTHLRRGWVFGSLAFLLLFTIILTDCRTALLALILILPALAIWHFRAVLRFALQGKTRWLLLGVVLVVGFGLLWLSWSYYQLKPRSVWGRILSWEVTLRILRDHWWDGVGFNNLTTSLTQYMGDHFREGSASDTERLVVSYFGSALNDYLETAATLGLAGLVFYIPFWALAMWRSIELLGRRSALAIRAAWTGNVLKERPRTTLYGGIAAVVLLYLLMSFFYYPSRLPALLLVFNLCLALVVSLQDDLPRSRRGNKLRISTTSRTGQFLSIAFGGAGLLLFFSFAWAGWHQHQATQQWSTARRAHHEGRMETADHLFQRARLRLHNHADFLSDYALFLQDVNRLDEATEMLERAVKLRGQPFLLELLAEFYGEAGSLEKAIETSRRASMILPWRLTSRFMLARFLERADRPTEAFQWAREVLLTPMKVPSRKALELKVGSRRILQRTAGDVLRDRGWEQSDFKEFPPPFRKSLTVAMAVAGDKARAWRDLFPSLSQEKQVAAAYLLSHMPESDLLQLSPDFLRENIDLAFLAKESPLYDPQVAHGIFLNYVLPYSQASEERESWRKDFYQEFLPLVSAAPSVSEAVKILNAEIWTRLGVSYGGSGESFQSPSESIAGGSADCIGLSIILANACRAVGIPARLVSVPSWIDVPGGHMWVEVYEQGNWKATGALDFSELDEAWFMERASRADPNDPETSIYAASFERRGTPLLMTGMKISWRNITETYQSIPPRYPSRLSPAAQQPPQPERSGSPNR